MNKYIISLLIVTILLPSNLLAKDNTESITTDKTSYALFKHRVHFICNKEPYKSSETIVSLKDNYLEINKKNEYSLTKIKESHRENMNTIYKCWLLTTQTKALLLIKNDLIKKSPSLSKKIEGKIQSNITKLDKISKSIWCSQAKSTSSIQKLLVLKQASLQTCKYISYLEYLIEYNKDIRNDLDPKKTVYNPLEIINNQNEKITKLQEEITHTYKVFPLAFHAYTEYENNITAHILLELLRDDYITFREKLHRSLNPINQVVYKIVNAMKK